MSDKEDPGSSNLDLTLLVNSSSWHDILPEFHEISQAVLKTTLGYLELKQTDLEISVVLADDEFLQNYNRMFRHKDRPTNVLSFTSLEEPFKIRDGDNLGDIMIACETLMKECEEQGKNIKDHYMHLLVHGVLHLIGYDHETDDEANLMESIEVQVLRKLGVANPYMESF